MRASLSILKVYLSKVTCATNVSRVEMVVGKNNFSKGPFLSELRVLFSCIKVNIGTCLVLSSLTRRWCSIKSRTILLGAVQKLF